MQASKFDDKAFFVRWWFRFLIAVDQLLNVLLLGFPDETLSGRLGRAMASGNPKWFVKPFALFVDGMFLFLMAETNHCLNSVEPEDDFDSRPESWRWHNGSK